MTHLTESASMPLLRAIGATAYAHTACRKCGRSWSVPKRVTDTLHPHGLLASCGVLALEANEPIGPSIADCHRRTALLRG